MENNKKIEITDFVEQFNKTESGEQNKLLMSIMSRKYAPVLEKKVILQTLLNKSIVQNEGELPYIDMFLSKVNMCAALLILYTNLNMKKDNESKNTWFDDYDLLRESGALMAIFGYIDESELKEVTSIYDILINEFYERNASTRAYMLSLVDRFANVFGEHASVQMQKFIDLVEEEDKVKSFFEKARNFVDKYINKK